LIIKREVIMFYRLVDGVGNNCGILQANIENDEFERLTKEYKHTTGNQLTITDISRFLTQKGYAVINVDPIEVYL